MSAAAAILTTASMLHDRTNRKRPRDARADLRGAARRDEDGRRGRCSAQEIPFVLGGGLAAWARGGPKSEHDVDFMIRPEDADAALDAIEAAGLRTERPPEGWLYKAWHANGALST